MSPLFSFICRLFVCFFVTWGLLILCGFVPSEVIVVTDSLQKSVIAVFTAPRSQAENVSSTVVPTNSGQLRDLSSPSAVVAIMPRRIVIDKIGVDSEIQNPESRDVAILDAALLKGVVHYPGSGNLNEDTNLFIFAHSTGLSNVRNQAYKAFNHLSSLSIDDLIQIESDRNVYVYKVVSVALRDNSEALVTFSRGKKMITLSTCNTFGKKDDRFVVEAVFVDEHPLSSVVGVQ